MPLDNPQYVGNLDSSNPKGTDSKTIADDSIRNFKEGVRMSFANVTGAVTSTHQDLNLVSGMATNSVKPLPGLSGQTVYYLYNNTAPPGTAIEAPDANVRELVIGPAASGGTIGGSDDPTNMSDSVNVSVSISGSTGSTTIAHTHGLGGTETSTVNGDTNLILQGTGAPVTVAGDGHTHTMSGQTADSGASTAHTHPSGSLSGSGSDTVSFQPRYARGILVKLDA